MQRAIRYATLTVIVHLLFSLFHLAAHVVNGVGLSIPDAVFVVAVIATAPIVGLILLYRSRSQRQLGAVIFLASMFGALIFGLYHHFILPGADNVAEIPLGTWGTVFQLTSLGIALAEAVGCVVGVWLVREANRLAAETRDGSEFSAGRRS